jgi:multidrug efflux pump subunit AcrA (membrane-fusion protein)
MKKKWQLIPLIVVIVGLVGFNVFTFVRVSKPETPAEEPDITRTPLRIYGRVEPLGGEIYISPTFTRRVTKIFIQEGGSLYAGQPICGLDDSVEKTRLSVAEAQLNVQKKIAEMSRDEYNRKENLYRTKMIADYEYLLAKLKKELDEKKIIAAEREVDAAREVVDQLVIRSPIDGIVYKLDLTLGETVAAGDSSRIVLGAPGLQVRLYVEVFWIDRLKEDAYYKVYSAETRTFIGDGRIIHRSPYLSSKRLRTDDPLEKFDTQFQEVLLALTGMEKNVPIGLKVRVELE